MAALKIRQLIPDEKILRTIVFIKPMHSHGLISTIDVIVFCRYWLFCQYL